MRQEFFIYLYQKMHENEKIVAITADLGYIGFDRIRNEFPKRFFNVGVAEQLAVDMGIGMALEGKIPFVYSITPFLLYRPFESLRTYINYESIPVKLIGSGRNNDYEHDGFSHYAGDDKDHMKQFGNIRSIWPHNRLGMQTAVTEAIMKDKPYYINLKR